LLLQVNLGLLKRMEREERLNDPGFHVEDSGAIGFAAGDAEGHFLQGPGCIDRIVMAEDQELTGWCGFLWNEGYAQMVAAVLLRNTLDVRATLAPFFRDDRAATVGGRFFEAGRFRGHEAP